MTMRNQITPYTTSYGNSPEMQAPSLDSSGQENHETGLNSAWSYIETVDLDRPGFYPNMTEQNECVISYPVEDGTFMNYSTDALCIAVGTSPDVQSFEGSHTIPVLDSFPRAQVPFCQSLLKCRLPTLTDYGAVTILLRHLIRVDITSNGSVCVYNFPAQTITALNAAGDKCFVKHPNGRVFQDGRVLHMVTGNNRFAKITPKGLTFSPTMKGLAYFIDESGTKTTTGKFTDLTKEIIMDIFFDGNGWSYDQLKQACYKMALEVTYTCNAEGTELWGIGKIRIKQDRWGEVTVSQRNGHRTIQASPTARRAIVESASVCINIDCFSNNYFTVRKDCCRVIAGVHGLTVHNRSQKAGLDRSGKLVLF